MSRIRICLGAAALLAVATAGCAQEEAAPEVDPAAGVTNAIPSDGGGSGAEREGSGSGPDATAGGSNAGGAGETEVGGSTDAGPGGEDPASTQGDGSAGRGGDGSGSTTGASGEPRDTTSRRETASGGSSGTEGGGTSSAPIGPEPDDPDDGKPTLSLAKLPIGGNASEPDAAGVQCADVAWLGAAGSAADLTPGIEVAVTGVGFSPDVFTDTGAGCAGLPPCKGFVYRDRTDKCSVTATPTDSAADSNGPYSFTLTGTVDCTAVGEVRCAEFAAAVAVAEDQSISLNEPTVVDSGTDGDSPPASSSNSPPSGE